MSCNGRPPTSPPEVCHRSHAQASAPSDERLRDRILNLGRGPGRRWIVPPADECLERIASGADTAGLIHCADTAPDTAIDPGAPVLAMPAAAVNQRLERSARHAGVALLAHEFASLVFQAFVGGTLGQRKRVVVSGQAIRVLGHGLLVTGPAGCGKSEATLGLLDRGHALVADDALQTDYRPNRGWTATACAEQHGRMAVRGLGMVDVARAFGSRVLADTTPLALEVRLNPHLQLDAEALLHGARRTPTLPDLPCLELPCAPVRNLPLLLETAARQAERYSHPPPTRSRL